MEKNAMFGFTNYKDALFDMSLLVLKFAVISAKNQRKKNRFFSIFFIQIWLRSKIQDFFDSVFSLNLYNYLCCRALR